jgi:hypothetical protein
MSRLGGPWCRDALGLPGLASAPGPADPPGVASLPGPVSPSAGVVTSAPVEVTPR